MDILLTHCAGICLSKRGIVVCALIGTVIQKEVKAFSTLTKRLFELLKWIEVKVLHSYQEEKKILLSIPVIKEHTAACIISLI